MITIHHITTIHIICHITSHTSSISSRISRIFLYHIISLIKKKISGRCVDFIETKMPILREIIKRIKHT